MTIHFLQRLSFKLARTSLLIVLALGFVVTCAQVYLDFRAENRLVDQKLDEIINVSLTAAQRAVHTLDNQLAQEVANGLAIYPFIREIRIEDEKNELMASANNPAAWSRTLWFTEALRGKESSYQIKIYNKRGNYEGMLTVTANNDLILRPLYKRAFYTLISGFTRNVILGLLLAGLFHWLLTRPLLSLAQNISLIDYREPKGKRIAHLSKHEKDELGFIINSANELIGHLESHQLELEERETQLRIILDASPNQVFAINKSGDFVFSNIATANFYNTTPANLEGKNYFDLHQHINVREADELIHSIKNTEASQEHANGIEQCLTDASGNDHVLQMNLMPFSLYGNQCVLVIGNDISARVAAEERVEKLAYFDTLTNLPNRNQLHEQLVADIEYTKQHRTNGAVLFIDIDDFKRINDTLGHSIGDELLLHLSVKMKAQLRQSETLARLGGDEFILSVPNISEDAESATAHAANLANRLLEAISAPIELSGHFFSIGASIGIATYPSVAKNVEQLLRFADTAMYEAKAAGRHCYRVFEVLMEEEARTKVKLESEIRQAIANNEFRFYLQPLLNAATHKLCGAEALIRWEHPQKGQIMPGEFIPFLEQSPMINQVGAQILDQVCGFLHAGLENGLMHEDFKISVNVSATEFFQPHFVEHIRSVLKRNKINGQYLELEITESVALEGFDNVIAKMHELQKDAVTFALDDFGTGFSSLNYLKKLPVNKIKIDKSFIGSVPLNSQDSSLVASVVQIAENLNLEVVVEGVESQVQAEYFGLMEHIVVQGYWYDAPMAPSSFVEKYLKSKQESLDEPF